MHERRRDAASVRVGDAGVAGVAFRAPLLPARRRTQELPASLSHWTGFMVIVAAHEIEVRYERALRHAELSVRDFVVLAEAAQRSGIGQTALAQRVGLSRSRLSDQVAALETAGLLERLLNVVDLRRRRVYLTPEGHRALAEGREAIGLADTAWLAQLRTVERPVFRALLERLQPHSERPWGYQAATST